MPNEIPIRIDADTSGFDTAMRDISGSSEQFARVFTSSLRGAVVAGRDFDDTLRGIARRISSMALSRALAPLENAIGGLLSGAAVPMPQAGRGGLAPAGLPPQIAGQAASVVFNVSTPDAASFRKSEGQVTAMLARAIARGHRSV
jgi:hypothetical protein